MMSENDEFGNTDPYPYGFQYTIGACRETILFYQIQYEMYLTRIDKPGRYWARDISIFVGIVPSR